MYTAVLRRIGATIAERRVVARSHSDAIRRTHAGGCLPLIDLQEEKNLQEKRRSG
jgi:hypothetical protein